MQFAAHRAPRTTTRILLVLSVLMFAACSSPPTIETINTAAPAATLLIAATSAPALSLAPVVVATSPVTSETPTPDDATDMPDEKTLIIGMTQAPDTLYGLESSSEATAQVLGALGSACYTTLGYAYQPTCFEQLPTFQNGGAITRTVKIDPAKINAANPIVWGSELITNTTDAQNLKLPPTLDQLVVTWRIKPHLHWEDGTPLTAADFVFGYKLAKDARTQGPSRTVVDRTLRMEAIDAHTLRTTFAPGYNDPAYFLDFTPPYPEHVLRDKDPAQIGTSEYANHPWGWGPYKIDDYVPGEEVTLVANPNYDRANEGLPKIPNVIFRFNLTPDELLTQLAAGEIDYVSTLDLTPEQTGALDQLVAAQKIKAQYVPGPRWEHLDFGIARGDEQSSFFDDVRVRQAVAYSIDRNLIVKQVMNETTAMAPNFVPTDHPYYPPNGAGLDLYPYHQARAKQLLAQAGYKPGKNGVLAKDGRAFQITLYTTEGNPIREASAKVIQQNLKTLGIQVEISLVPGPAKLFKVAADGILYGRTFDLALYTSSVAFEPDVATYQCIALPTEENSYTGPNTSGYCNRDFDAVVARIEQATTKEQHLPLMIEAEKLFNRDLPTLPLFQYPKIAAFGPNVTGPTLNATEQDDFYNLAQWDIQEPTTQP